MTQETPTTTTALPRREREFLALLRQWAKENKRKADSKTQIPLEAILKAFRNVRNRNPEGEFEPAVLDGCLKVLERRGLIKAFAKRTPETVSLPVKIWLLPEDRPVRAKGPMPRWHHELSWLAQEWQRSTPKQRAAYTAINLWRKSDPDLFAVPIRERALEIFGTFGSETDFPMPEKTFDELKSGPLFSDPERLDEILRTLRPPPPLLTETFPLEEADDRYRRVGTGDVLLVVENSTTWWSLVECLPEQHRLGYVAWGLGGTFRASVRAITVEHRISEIRYFGDLDLSGVRIPLKASLTASQLGLPSVQPTAMLYKALLDLGRPRNAKEAPADAAEAVRLANWLPTQHRADTVDLLMEGKRIAQEWVGYRYLKRNMDWYSDIR
ncbi:Wadjet anti-phage system protein JetD domain-containing protein [Nocardiopsis sp. CNS-639]|uniref:Wadjet anti-phage system protein JetD domain-containing protein n=1 Tax=Nocardiopsis sp. CNS-639 TaxID=1169153 RepID=UPI0003A701C6|nr:Wadjet anti-phage system protein JetD domain-containing protein [Nocardiopsis sp. CNS-639]